MSRSPSHALKLVQGYFRDCAAAEEAEERRAGRRPVSKTYAGYLNLCESLRQFAGAFEGIDDPQAARAVLNDPPYSGGWVNADFCGGWTCHVDQGHYGHRAKKPTWLYAVSRDLPSMRWGESAATVPVEHMGKRERAATPSEFRDVLISIAEQSR